MVAAVWALRPMYLKKEMFTMTSAELRRFTDLASTVVPITGALLGEGSEGAYIYICNDRGQQLLLLPFGEIDPKMAPTYKQLSQEKASRLLVNPQHTSSSQSRDPDNQQYGGAIRLYGSKEVCIISCSGLPELVDEALCAALALKMGWANEIYLLEILTRSRNVNNFDVIRNIST